MRIVPIILSGGMGVRLWPLSRRARPKQFLNLGGDESLIVETIKRVCDSELFHPAIFVCNDEHRFMVAEQLRRAGMPKSEILLEPEARNTGPAIASATAYAQEKYGDVVLLVLPSDHLIQDAETFVKAILLAEKAALDGRIVTLGITPESPDTGYGYIEAGSPLSDIEDVQEIKRFMEKPNLDTAVKFLASGQYYWNGGIFALTTETAVAAFDAISPDIMSAANSATKNGQRDLDFMRLDVGAYKNLPAESFDNLVMEKFNRGAVVPVDMGWSDIGSWNALWKSLPHDEEGNAIVGDVTLDDSKNCIVHAEHGLATVVGVDGLVVVVTDDSVLVMDRARSQDLKKIVDKLDAMNRPEVVTARRVHRPWGTYQDIDRGAGFRAKRITVIPGGRLSLQKHAHRAEHWIIVDGTAHVTKGDEEIVLSANQSIYISAGEIHRLENKSDEDLHLIEVQTGDYLEEDDIIRFDDSYGRN